MRQDPKTLLHRVFRGARPEGSDPAAPLGSAVSSGARTRQLWGETFFLVENGLDPAQVIHFVEDLLGRYKRLEEKGGTSASVSAYLQKVMGEIDRVEETITAQIRRDAEAEAARVIAASREEAIQVVAQARKEATEQAAREAEGILGSAHQKAEAAEGQIRLQVQRMMEKAQEEIQEHIRQQGNEAYRRLLGALQGLSTESQRLEEQWKRQPARLLNPEDFRLRLDEEVFSSPPQSESNG